MSAESGKLFLSLERVAGVLNEPVIVVDSDGLVISANVEFKDAFAIRKYGIRKGSSVSKVLLDLPELREFILRTILQKQDEIDDLLMYGKNYYNVKVSRVSEKNEFAYFFLFHDVTAQETMDQMRKKFTSNIAHELRTPLAGISSIAELIAYSDKLSKEDMQKEAIYIYEEVHRLSKMVNELLEISKFDQNVTNLKIETIDVEDLLAYVNTLMKKKIEAKNLTLRVENYVETIDADFNSLVQILINLLDNACEYAKSGIRIKITKQEKNIRIKIEDDGIGMTQYQLTRIFDRFYRTDESRNKNSGGTGLGLSIVKELVNASNGKIKVRSKVGIGTDFIVDFPVE